MSYKSPTLAGAKLAGCSESSHVGGRSNLPISPSSDDRDGEIAYEPHSDVMILKFNKTVKSSVEGTKPLKKSKTGKPLDLMVVESHTNNSDIVEINSHIAVQVLEDSPALVHECCHSMSLSLEKIFASPSGETNIPLDLSLRELHQVETISQINDVSASVISGVEYSNFKIDESEHRAKEIHFFYKKRKKATHFHNSIVGYGTSDFLPNAERRNYRDAYGPKDAIVETKNLVIGTPHQEMASNVAMGDHLPEQIETRRKGRAPETGRILGTEQLDEAANFSAEIEEAMKQHQLKGMELRGGRPAKERRITLKPHTIKGTELKQFGGTVEREDRREEIELLNCSCMPHVFHDVLEPCHKDNLLGRENSRLLSTVDGEPLPDNSISTCWTNKQDEIFGNIHATPQLESSSRVFKSHPTNQQLSNVISSSFHRAGEVTDYIKRLDKGGVAAQNQAHLSPLEKDNVSSHNVIALSRSAAERTIVGVDCTLIESFSSALSSKETVLPFTKKSYLWESVESMDVFQVMPQQPHFQPMEQYFVDFREGMAIGLMVSFANLVSDISKLQIVDSQETFEERLKALVVFESNGFNVQSVRSRLEELLLIRTNSGYSMSKEVGLKEKIIEKEEEKGRLDELVIEHDKLIMKVEENLAIIRERKSSLVKEKEKKDSEIAKLEMAMQAVQEACRFTEQQFKVTLAAPF